MNFKCSVSHLQWLVENAIDLVLFYWQILLKFKSNFVVFVFGKSQTIKQNSTFFSTVHYSTRCLNLYSMTVSIQLVCVDENVLRSRYQSPAITESVCIDASVCMRMRAN